MRRRSPLAILLALVAAGCPGSLEDPARFAGEFGMEGGSCSDVPTFLSTTCGLAACHGATSPQQGLDLVSPDVHARLSGVMAKEGPGLLIDPSNPSASVLYTKMKGPAPFGALMPLGGVPVADAETACVLAWIASAP